MCGTTLSTTTPFNIPQPDIMTSNHPMETPVRVRRYWPELVSDTEATIEQYKEQGYEGTLLQPGPITFLNPEQTDDAPGLSVLLPSSGFSKVKRINEDESFTSADVYAATTDDLVLLGIYLKSVSETKIIGFPAYYDRSVGVEILESTPQNHPFYIHFRTLENNRIIISCADPSQFLPTDVT